MPSINKCPLELALRPPLLSQPHVADLQTLQKQAELATAYRGWPDAHRGHDIFRIY